MKNKKIAIITVSLLLLLPACLFAQTAAELVTVLEAPVVTCAQAATFVIGSANIDHGGNAFEYAAKNGWIRNASAQTPITLGMLSHLVMKAFNIKGGMMYSIFHGQRYAYRSMVSQSYIQGISDPAMTVTGERFLLLLGKVLSAEGGEQ